MGTDIHGILQIRENGSWKDFSDGYDDRNYRAFGLLANVRNGVGFAGIAMGEPVEPISEPRGLPADFELGSFLVDNEFDQEQHPINNPDFHLSDWNLKLEAEHPGEDWVCNLRRSRWMGDHSHSYVTAADLEKVDWLTPVLSVGVISLKEFRQRKPNTEPQSHCGSISGPGIKIFDERDYVEGLEKGYDEDKIYIRAYWTQSYAETFGERFMAFVRQMQDLGKSYGRENVRFVFGFDS